MSLAALSPLDGRYWAQAEPLAHHLSELALIRHRVEVEIEWLLLMGERPEITGVRAISAEERDLLRSWVTSFDETEAAKVREIERGTRLTHQHAIPLAEHEQ